MMHHDEPAKDTIGEEVRPMDDKSSDVMNIDGLAEYLKLPKSTVYKLAQSGELPGRKAGRQWRFHKEGIDKWLLESPAVGGSENGGE